MVIISRFANTLEMPKRVWYNGSTNNIIHSVILYGKLSAALINNVAYRFTYNDVGLRTSKIDRSGNETVYLYSGDLLICEYDNSGITSYIYDAFDSPIGFTYRATGSATDETYWYEKNLFGDIAAIYNNNGAILISYVYDAWGNFSTTYHNNGEATSVTKNNITYRGYYYDSDLGMYYLQSRYYDPAIGRFISPDSLLPGVSGSLHGYNLYVYCFNNPVTYIDSTGNWPSLNSVKKWFVEKIELLQELINDVCDNINKDIQKFDINNEKENVVLESHYFSAYKGVIVVRVPVAIGLSYGIIVLGKGKNETSLKHEYGHSVQLKQMGIIKYTSQVAVPSFVASWVHAFGKLPFDYYTSPWEFGADFHGGVIREKSDERSWNSTDGYFNYLIDIFK